MTRHTNAIGMGQADDSLRRGEGRVRRLQSLLSLALVLALALPLGLLVPGAAHARIDRSDFLTRSTVKAMMNGTGKWVSSTHRVKRPLGAKPARCRSDKPFGAYKEARRRVYNGYLRGAPTGDHINVSTTVYRYGSRKAARKAMRLLKGYASDCPRTFEWVCTQCDGISTSLRKPVAMRRIGQQSTAWRLRMKKGFLINGYVITTRKQRTIVKVTVENVRIQYRKGTSLPKALSKRKTVSLAKVALWKAT